MLALEMQEGASMKQPICELANNGPYLTANIAAVAPNRMQRAIL